ncbi:MAG: hypothetical protein ABFS86_14985 [Planctomycetota bacterium]
MRIKLQQVSNFVCLPLPPSVAGQRGFGVGDEVEVIFDEDRGQVVFRPAGAETDPVEANPEFAAALDEFIARYGTVLTELGGM